MEEKNEEKSIVEEIVNSNQTIDNKKVEDILNSKEECEKLIKDFTDYINNHKPLIYKWINDSDFGCEDLMENDEDIFEDAFPLVSIKNDNEYISLMNEFKLKSRTSIISEKDRLLFIIRQEELHTTVNNLQKKLEEYDSYVAEHGEDEAESHFKNYELHQFLTIRNQSIPMYLIELETVASAIKDNEKTYYDSTCRSYRYAKSLLEYIKNKKF